MYGEEGEVPVLHQGHGAEEYEPGFMGGLRFVFDDGGVGVRARIGFVVAVRAAVFIVGAVFAEQERIPLGEQLAVQKTFVREDTNMTPSDVNSGGAFVHGVIFVKVEHVAFEDGEVGVFCAAGIGRAGVEECPDHRHVALRRGLECPPYGQPSLQRGGGRRLCRRTRWLRIRRLQIVMRDWLFIVQKVDPGHY